MALTTTQRTDIQGDLGITADESVFTDDELDRLYARADNDYNLAVYYGFRQLVASANKYHRYVAGFATEDLQQVRANLKDSLQQWKGEARSSANQVQMAGLLEIPPRDKDEPWDADDRQLRQ